MSRRDGAADRLSDHERARLAAFRTATSLASLVPLTDADAEHAAYLAAKREWRHLRDRELGPSSRTDDLPGATITVGDADYRVHGITHAATPAEGDFLRSHVEAFLDAGHDVYCEQGIRSMYFDEYPSVCEIDDYRWAMARCRELDVDSHVSDVIGSFDGVGEQVATLASRFRDVAFSLVDAGRDVYGDEFARTLGDIATDFLMGHEDLATGNDFASFAISEAAAEDPRRLPALQRYYETAFLPQPLEREWLWRHDPELEVVTHARNEYMADYAVDHHDGNPLHVITGAAHQPGIRYYLERHRDGDRSLADFEPPV